MRKDLSFYNCDDELFAPKGIERTNILANVSREDFMSKHIDFLFLEYIEGRLEKENSKNDEDLRMVNTLNSIHTIFSNTSFGKWISEFEKENIAEVIKNPHDTVTNEQRIQLIGKLQRFIDSYINREYIIRKLREEEEIHDSPLGYATFLLLKEQGDMVGVEFIHAQKADYTMIGFGFISFFTNFLANKLFKKTQEQVIEESKHDALFTLKMNFSECLQMYYGIFDSLQDTVQRGKYIQGLHNLHTKENGLITPKSATSFVEEVERLLEGLVESNVKVSKDDNDARQRILNLFKDIFDKFFAEALPKEGEDIRVDVVEIGNEKKLLSKDNFYFHDSDINELVDELKSLHDAVGGASGYMDPKFRSKDYTQLIREGNIFDILGRKLRWGDFNVANDFSKLQGTYYILTQDDGFFIKDEKAIEDQEKIWDSDIIKQRFEGIADLEGDFTQPTMVDTDYIRATAKYKIHKGKLIPNVFL